MTGFADHLCAGHPGDLLVPTPLHESETLLRLAQQAVYKDVCVEENDSPARKRGQRIRHLEVFEVGIFGDPLERFGVEPLKG